MSFSERLASGLLSNPRSERVRGVAALTRRSVRSKRGLFRAEGPQNVREALKCALDTTPPSGLPSVHAVYVTLNELERHPGIEADLEAVSTGGGTLIRAVTESVLDAMTDAVTPQGMLAVCSMGAADRDHLLSTVELACALVRVQDPGNAGAIVRTADAAGAGAIVLTVGSVDVYNPKSVRSCAGSIFHVPVVTGADLTQVSLTATHHGLGVLAADGHANVSVDDLYEAALLHSAGVDLRVACEYDLKRPTLWLFGNEAQGLSSAERALADMAVRVPMYGSAESLNVASAATVCLFASARARYRRH